MVLSITALAVAGLIQAQQIVPAFSLMPLIPLLQYRHQIGKLNRFRERDHHTEFINRWHFQDNDLSVFCLLTRFYNFNLLNEIVLETCGVVLS